MDKINGRNFGAEAETGFTIVETVVAIAIFSFLIIFCLGMFIFVGRIYYRGLYEGQTQEVARSIVDNVSEGLRNTGKDVEEYTPNSDGWKAYCIGGIQYSFRENIQLIKDGAVGDRQATEVFVVSDYCNDNLANPEPPSDCPVPPPTPPACASQKVELMHEKMRLLRFIVKDQGDGLFDVEIKIALGGDASDLEFDSTVFKYVDNLSDGDIDNLTDMDVEVDPEDPSFAVQVGWDSTNKRPVNSAEYYSNHDAGGTETVDLVIAQCQSGETFCAMIDFKTKAFRRVF